MASLFSLSSLMRPTFYLTNASRRWPNIYYQARSRTNNPTISWSFQYVLYGRAFSSKTSTSGQWLNGDPLMDQWKETVISSISSRIPNKVYKRIFHLRPSGDKALEEESFQLSNLDLFNTQNYSVHALFFKTEDSEKPAIIDTLTRGIQAALSQCRHMFGTVEPNDEGGFSIVKKPTSTVKLVVQSLEDPAHVYPSFSDLERARFSSQILGDQALLTIEGMTMGCRRPPNTSPAVAAFQVNLIPGGIILTVHKHHAALDIAGTTSLVHQIAGNCSSVWRNTPPPSWDASLMDRSRFVTKVPKEKLIDPPVPPGRHPDWHPCSWLLFHLPPSKAKELKRIASPDDGTWISTHDALAALVWRVMMRNRARIYSVDLPSPALFFEAINMRERINPKLDPRYQGNCLSAGQSLNQPQPLTLAEVISDVPLSRIATFIRKLTTSATQKTLENTVNMLGPFRNKWMLHPRLDAIPPMSLVVTDWRGAQMCEADFGFGRPAAFRQLSDVVLENMVIIYPPLKSIGEEEQGLEVVIPFEKHALHLLMEDADVKEFFEFRGIESCQP